MNSSIIIIYNPVAKKASAKKVAMASYYLQSKGCKVEIMVTEKKGDAESLTKQAIKKAPSSIIAAGGDGTFNEVMNGLVGSNIPMAILPLGITNVLAKELGIPEDIKGSMENALKGNAKTVSLGKVIPQHNQAKSRYFCLMAGIGFDGEAVFGINEKIKKISGKGSYIFSGIKVLTKYHPNELKIDINGNTYSGYSAIIGKAAKYGGHFKITPDSRLTDPEFYICIFKGNRRLDILRYVLGVLTKRHIGFNDVEYLKAKRVQVIGNAHIQLDGDYFDTTPATIEVVPDIARLIYPKKQ